MEIVFGNNVFQGSLFTVLNGQVILYIIRVDLPLIQTYVRGIIFILSFFTGVKSYLYSHTPAPPGQVVFIETRSHL